MILLRNPRFGLFTDFSSAISFQIYIDLRVTLVPNMPKFHYVRTSFNRQGYGLYFTSFKAHGIKGKPVIHSIKVGLSQSINFPATLIKRLRGLCI